MPKSKSAYLRYQVINECLTSRTHRYWTATELLERLRDRDLPVSQRTLEYDLTSMRHDERLGYHAPIAYCRRNRAFHYTDTDYSIAGIPLQEEEVRAFSVLVSSLQRFRGAHMIHQVQGLLDKLRSIASHLRQPRSGEVAWVEFEEVPYYKGIQFFDRLLEAVHQRHALRIGYKKFDHQRISEHVMHPYLLKEFRQRWYVWGYSEARSAVIILALDRIESLERETVPFRSPEKDHKDAFRNVIGISLIRGRAEEVVLKFSPAQGNYVKTLHLHHSQEILSDTSESLVVRLHLVPNTELVQLIMGFMPDVEVVEPVSLRKKVREMLEKGALRHG